MKIFKTTLKIIGALIALLVVALLLTGLTLKAFAPRISPPGKLVDVGGHKLHIHCTGSLHGSPPVVIEAGLGVSSSYYYWIQSNLEKTTKVCTYDRAGMGWSEDSKRPRDLGDVVDQLHALLAAASVERPFVLAGHSLGAIILREYVTRYPDEVAGLAFLDGSHPDQTQRLGLEKLDQQADAERDMKIYRLMVRLGLTRLYDPALSQVAAAFPEEILKQLQYTNDRAYFDTVLGEVKGLVPYTNRPRPHDTFGDRPIVVVQAGDSWDPAALPDTVDAARLAAEWPKLQQSTAALSTRGRYVVIQGASHMSLIDHQKYANEAAEQIREVLKALEQR